MSSLHPPAPQRPGTRRRWRPACAASLVAAAALVLVTDATPAQPTIDGLWIASSTSLAGSTSMTLKVQGAQVVGSGQIVAGALAPQAFRVTGTFRPPTLELIWTFGDAAPWSFKGRQVDTERLTGEARDEAGTRWLLEFVRP